MRIQIETVPETTTETDKVGMHKETKMQVCNYPHLLPAPSTPPPIQPFRPLSSELSVPSLVLFPNPLADFFPSQMGALSIPSHAGGVNFSLFKTNAPQ